MNRALAIVALAVGGVAWAQDPDAVPWTDTPRAAWPDGVHVSYDVICPTVLTLDADGRVIASTSDGCPDAFVKAIEAAVRRWRTKPLAEWGHAGETSLTVAKTFVWRANSGVESQTDEIDAPTTQTTETFVPTTEVRWTRNAQPPFPLAAQQQGLTEGTCVMRVHVAESGKVIAAEALDCASPFDVAARDALLKWRAMPVESADGQGVWTKVSLRFRAAN